MKIAYLNISSFRGISVGARHYYGSIIVTNDGGERTYDTHDINRTLTLKEAKDLNSQDEGGSFGGFGIWSTGDETNRIDTKDEVRELGIKLANELSVDCLIEGRPSLAEPQPVLYGPQWYIDATQPLVETEDEDLIDEWWEVHKRLENS